MFFKDYKVTVAIVWGTAFCRSRNGKAVVFYGVGSQTPGYHRAIIWSQGSQTLHGQIPFPI